MKFNLINLLLALI